MLKIEFTKRFKKDYRVAVSRGCDPAELSAVVFLLADEKPLPPSYRDHALADSKEYKGVRECHIKPDWLLIYKVYRDRLVLELIRTGTHADLFE